MPAWAESAHMQRGQPQYDMVLDVALPGLIFEYNFRRNHRGACRPVRCQAGGAGHRHDCFWYPPFAMVSQSRSSCLRQYALLYHAARSYASFGTTTPWRYSRSGPIENPLQGHDSAFRTSGSQTGSWYKCGQYEPSATVEAGSLAR